MSTPMDYRSTNVEGRHTHFGGTLVAGVDFGRGIELNPASTASGIPSVRPVGDDANISIAILAKGTGSVLLGSTATGNLPFKGVFTQNSTYSHAAIGASRSLELTFASTTIDINPGDLIGQIGLVVAPANLSSQVNLAHHRLSTDASSRLTITLSNVQSTATSTGSGTLQITWIDLT